MIGHKKNTYEAAILQLRLAQRDAESFSHSLLVSPSSLLARQPIPILLQPCMVLIYTSSSSMSF